MNVKFFLAAKGRRLLVTCLIRGLEL